MYSQYLGISTQKYWGRGLVQTFPLFYFVKNIIQTKKQCIQFPANDCIQPQMLTALKGA